MIIAPNLALQSNDLFLENFSISLFSFGWHSCFIYFDILIAMHLQRLSLLFIASSSKKKVLELNTTLNQSSHRTVKHHCLWLQNEHGQQFCKEFAPRPVGTNNNETIPANRSFYWRAKYNNQENYYPATEGRSHDNFHSCIFIPG